MARLVTIAIYDNRPSALVAWSLLDQHGIPAFLPDNDTINVAWHLTLALGGVRLAVPEPDVTASRKLLDLDTRPVEDPETAFDTCPHCGSTDIFRPFSWVGVGVAITLVLAYNVYVPVFMGSTRRFCRTCSQRWRRTG